MGSRSMLVGTDKALTMLRSLPRICLGNIRDDSGNNRKSKRGRGQHGGDKHGAGNKGSGQRQNYMRIGYETGNTPFYLRFGIEPYYQGHHLRRQYPPFPLYKLQMAIDTNRIDPSKPIDLCQLVGSGLYRFKPEEKHFGVNLTDDGAELFKSKVNIEVQWATEQVIAAVERNGGVITTAYYDPHSLLCLHDPKQFFNRGVAIPKRMMPPPDAIEYYTDPAFRGYLADPDEISKHRLILAQKYGYTLPKIEDDPQYEMLNKRKDPRQVYYDLEPGWVVNLKEKCILKPKDEKLLEYYSV